MGFDAYAGFEYEVFFFDETPESIRAKALSRPETDGARLVRLLGDPQFRPQRLLSANARRRARQMDFGIEGLHEETGPGVIEAAITFDSALASADKAALFKTFVKVLAQRSNMMATFMAKWSTRLAGPERTHPPVAQGRATATPVFYDAGAAASDERDDAPLRRRPAAADAGSCWRWWRRPSIRTRGSIPGFWAPTDSTVGVENRTCALRVIPGSAKSQRVEYRVAAADANPYIILAGGAGIGLVGHRERSRARAARRRQRLRPQVSRTARPCRARCGMRPSG